MLTRLAAQSHSSQNRAWMGHPVRPASPAVLSLPLSCFRWVLRQLNGRTVPDAPGRAPSRMWGKSFRYLSAISEAQLDSVTSVTWPWLFGRSESMWAYSSARSTAKN